MTAEAYTPTKEQEAIIVHEGHAFVRACPGAGKTRTMVERARQMLSESWDRRGVAFLSFTNAAVEELEGRLRSFGVLPSPLFPSFIGTFDKFLWQFLITPFGVDGCSQPPRLVPDKSDWEVRPYEVAQALKLKHFNRATGAFLPDKAVDTGFAPKNGPGAWETTARGMIARARSKGYLDFEDVRDCVATRLADKLFAARLGAALSARFREIVVDEAQDCNPADLEIIEWLRGSGITVKVVCDPNQAIYAFRGGVTDELLNFAKSFGEADQLPMSGNFRSSPAICAAISQLRPPSTRGAPDQAVGRHKDEAAPVYILSYGGTGVPAAIGARFQTLAAGLGIAPAQAPVLAATWASAGSAVGRALPDAGNDKTLLLAEAVMAFHFSFAAGNRREALTRLHRVVLQVRGIISNAGDYTAHVTANGRDDGRWRPEIIAVGQALKVVAGESVDDWLKRARLLLGTSLVGTSTIGQRLRANKDLESVLAEVSPTALPAKAIHAVKGLEFPAVCVVLTVKKAGDILGVLTGSVTDPDTIEEARKIYVGASRAERLLAIATPKRRAAGLKAILDAGGCNAEILAL
ncbi:MAG: ATP-dependent helicase [Phenylobacterium sp.]|uniref:UvrD-helicase domain-containing protein n=1 Tax=Phenylobacterium sp. TaxID=1871053 RepID=UPI001A4F224E|nr:ATP-dependent helicase [Phenylobacterium sp.]MBL8772181.1 ATP-dependent helicase [Phenylobacterium sp.]